MKNVLHLFVGDLKRLGCNVVTVIVVLGLVALPSLFSWYNMIACWNVFDNTGNLTVAVANSDDGYTSDLVPIRINIGEQIVGALRANDQLNWVFTNEDDAIDGTMSGRYYAAVVIPSSFSRDMMTFYQDDMTHAKITYYCNEKKSAIAPKVTDQGADAVSAQVNQVFAETISDAALSIASALLDYADDADAGGAIGTLGQHVGDTAKQMSQAAGVLRAYAGVLDTTEVIVSDSAKLMADATDAANSMYGNALSAASSAGKVSGALDSAVDGLSATLQQSAALYVGLGDALTIALDNASGYIDNSTTELHDRAAWAAVQADDYATLAENIAAVRDALPEDAAYDDARAALDSLHAQMLVVVDLQRQLADLLEAAASGSSTASDDLARDMAQAQQAAADAADALNGVRATYDTRVKPKLDDVSARTSQASAGMQAAMEQLNAAEDDLSGKTGSVTQQVGSARTALSQAADELDASAEKLQGISDGIAQALASGDMDLLRKIIGSDPSALASALSAPVQLDRHAYYPVENFGSAMSPLYTSLAVWIGSLLCLITFKTSVGEKSRRGLIDPTPWQLFWGRFLSIATVSLMQTTLLAAGNLLFLHVQCVHPLLYMLCFWVSGLVDVFMIYTCVCAFGNLGKAIGVILLIVQVSGAGGSFPLQLLPPFFSMVSPWLPLTHTINAMRAAMFGLYGADYWVQLGELALFVLPFLLIAQIVRTPAINFVHQFIEKVEMSKVM